MGTGAQITVEPGGLSEGDARALAELDAKLKAAVDHGRAVAGLAAGPVVGAALRMETGTSGSGIAYGLCLMLGALCVLCGLFGATLVTSRRDPAALVPWTERRLTFRVRCGVAATVLLSLSLLTLVAGAAVELVAR